MHSLLNSAMNKDIVLIQEPWIFKDNKTTVSHSAFTTLLSSSNLDVRPRTVAFVNKYRPNFVCTPRPDIFMNSDLQAITISINNSSETVLLLNIYNEKSQEEDSDMWTVERKLKDIQLFSKSIVCKDFNTHHSWWNSEVEHSIRATVLTHWLDVQDCELLNTPDETTYTHYFENPSSVIDLTFTTSAMLAFVKDWQINEEIAIGSDHEVIQFVISTKEAEMVESSLNPPYNTVKADWTKFAKQLQQESAKISDLAKTLSTNSKDLKEIAISFRNLILDAANQHISKRKPSIKAKVWWHNNLNSLRKSMFIVKRDWKFNQTEDNWKKVISHKNKYFHAIQTAKQASWTTFLQGAVGKDVFTAYHFIKPRKVAKIPPIQHENHLGITFQEKSKMFLKAMFSPPSESAATALKSDDSDTIAWNTTTFKEVEQAIKSSSPRKAPKPDGIFFLIIHQAFQGVISCYICKIPG